MHHIGGPHRPNNILSVALLIFINHCVVPDRHTAIMNSQKMRSVAFKSLVHSNQNQFLLFFQQNTGNLTQDNTDMDLVMLSRCWPQILVTLKAFDRPTPQKGSTTYKRVVVYAFRQEIPE